jgi:hypothetical protein
MQIDLNHNVWEYINQPVELTQGNFSYKIDFPDDKHMSLQRFLDAYYYHRRRNFGKSIIKPL